MVSIEMTLFGVILILFASCYFGSIYVQTQVQVSFRTGWSFWNFEMTSNYWFFGFDKIEMELLLILSIPAEPILDSSIPWPCPPAGNLSKNNNATALIWRDYVSLILERHEQAKKFSEYLEMDWQVCKM